MKTLRSLSLALALTAAVASTGISQEKPEPIDSGATASPGETSPQPKAQRAEPAQAAALRRAGSTPANQAIVDQLNDILDNQARFGLTPFNTPLLADIDQLIRRYSLASRPVVELTNMGPGIVEIQKPDGTTITLFPRFRVDLNVDPGETGLVAVNDFANIEFRHLANGACRFWDGDDRRFTTLDAPTTARRPVKIILGRGLNHYYLEP